MKKMFFATLALVFSISAFAKHSWPMGSLLEQSWSLNLLEQNNCEKTLAGDDDWILVGEVRLSVSYRNFLNNGVRANLYIREVANKIIYRIEYNGNFYAVGKGYNEVDNVTYYYVTIGNVTYYFNVQ